MVEVYEPRSEEQVCECWPAFEPLRPHLDGPAFMRQVQRQRVDGYRILALRQDGLVHAVAGFRIVEFLAWGKILYLDDLSTAEPARGQGHATRLLDRLEEIARAAGCVSIHLDTGHARHAAHRLYLRRGFRMTCHHMELSID